MRSATHATPSDQIPSGQSGLLPCGSATRRRDWLSVRRVARRLAGWMELRRQRRALARLDAHLLDDVGLPADTAGHEARRPFWDAPRHWRCWMRRAGKAACPDAGCGGQSAVTRS